MHLCVDDVGVMPPTGFHEDIAAGNLIDTDIGKVHRNPFPSVDVGDIGTVMLDTAHARYGAPNRESVTHT